jgi:hypothetical protein
MNVQPLFRRCSPNVQANTLRTYPERFSEQPPNGSSRVGARIPARPLTSKTLTRHVSEVPNPREALRLPEAEKIHKTPGQRP